MKNYKEVDPDEEDDNGTDDGGNTPPPIGDPTHPPQDTD